MADSTATPLPKQIGRYQIVCELGQGGMAHIYLGRAMGPGGFERLVAIKMIHPHLCFEEAFVAMFLDEARIAARIHHPNIVQVHEVAKHENQYFIAMDYVNGETLAGAIKHSLKEGRKFPLDLTAYIAVTVSDALHSAHELTDHQGSLMNVVHRDVSPQNIMIGYDGIPRVTDFGIAKATNQLSTTSPGTHKGKFAYMAPEQLRGKEFDRRADIFALGVVLWETTVGKRLFRGPNDFATAQRVLHMEVPAPSSLRADFPPRLEEIMLKALSRDPEQRYKTARELSQDLRGFISSTSAVVSAFDLERFMKECFPDRHASRMSLVHTATTGEVHPAARGLSEDSLSLSNVDDNIGEEILDEGSKNAIAAEPVKEDRTEVRPFLEAEPVADPIAEKVKNRRWPSALAAAAGAVALSVSVVLAVQDSAPKVITVLPAKTEPELVVAAPAETKPAEIKPIELEKVTIVFRAKPSNTSIIVGGIAHTGALVVPKSSEGYRVEFSAPMHKPFSMSVKADRSHEVVVELEPIKEAQVKAKARRSAEPRKSASKESRLFNENDL